MSSQAQQLIDLRQAHPQAQMKELLQMLQMLRSHTSPSIVSSVQAPELHLTIEEIPETLRICGPSSAGAAKASSKAVKEQEDQEDEEEQDLEKSSFMPWDEACDILRKLIPQVFDLSKGNPCYNSFVAAFIEAFFGGVQKGQFKCNGCERCINHNCDGVIRSVIRRSKKDGNEKLKCLFQVFRALLYSSFFFININAKKARNGDLYHCQKQTDFFEGLLNGVCRNFDVKL